MNTLSRLGMTVLYPGSVWGSRYYNNLDANYLNSAGDMVPNPDYRLVEGNAHGVLQVRKYMEPILVADMGNYDGNIMVLRLAEMYLTFAEAALATGQHLGLALEYISVFRTERHHEFANRGGYVRPKGVYSIGKQELYSSAELFIAHSSVGTGCQSEYDSE